MKCSYCGEGNHREMTDWYHGEDGYKVPVRYVRVIVKPDDLLEWICEQCQGSYQNILRRQRIRKARGVCVKSVGEVSPAPVSLLATHAT